MVMETPLLFGLGTDPPKAKERKNPLPNIFTTIIVTLETNENKRDNLFPKE